MIYYHLWGKIEQAAGTIKHKLEQEESSAFNENIHVDWNSGK